MSSLVWRVLTNENSNIFLPFNIGCILLRDCPGLYDAYQIATLGISKELGDYLRTITCGFAGREVNIIMKFDEQIRISVSAGKF